MTVNEKSDKRVMKMPGNAKNKVDGEHLKVLIIEDNPVHARLMQEMVARTNGSVELHCADRLSNGLTHLSSREVGLVLLDLSLPDSQGLDTLYKVQAHAPEVAIVILSALNDKELAIEAIREGAQDYLVKGQVDSNSLDRAVRYAIERKRMQDALKESEAQYRELAESISDVFFAFDEDLKYTYWNKASEKLTGIPAKDALGKHLYDIFPDSEQTRKAEKAYKKVLRTRRPLHFVTEYQLEGKDFSFEISAYPSKRGLSVFTKDATGSKRVEKRWWDSMSNFHKVISSIADGIIITNRQGIVRFVNPAAESLFGRKSEDFKGCQIGFPISSGGTTEIDIIRKTRESVVAEMRVVETVWYDEPVYLASLRDITERRQNERDLMIKDNAIASSVNPVAIANFAGILTYVNPAFLEIWGHDSYGEVLGKSITEFWTSEEQVQATVKALHEKKSWRGELVVKRKNGLEFYSQMSLSPVIDSDDRVIAIMASIIDLTERKRSEQVQERLNLQLQAQVSELETFSYGIAHDLRSPLVSIEGFSRELRTDIQNMETERVQEDIRLLESGVRKMQDFLDSTLEYSRSGHLIKRIKNVSFGEIVEKVIIEFNGQISSIGATVSVAKTFPRVYVDRMRIIQVLTNLIQNSVKYRDKTVPLKIEIGHRLSKGETIFFVRDNGLGMDASDAEKAFDLFYRGTADGQGSGVGLSVVKKIIEAHGGRIWAQQGQSGKGTTMCFTLPKQSGTNKGDNNGKD